MKTYNLSIIGGDFRSIAAANKLANSGNGVKVFGFDDKSEFNNNVQFAENLYDAIESSKYVLLPLPYCSANKVIFAPLTTETIKIDSMISNLTEKNVILAGKIDEEFKKILIEKNITFHDYFSNEEFSVKNAIPTAEGAIEIALSSIPITLNNSSCLVTGYGRISKLLSSILSGFGAHVTVAARKHSDIAWITANGYNARYISQISENIHKYDVIFNTVPHKIFDKELLKKVSKECLIIDLASKPGGVDFEEANSIGLNVIWALSLPGKAAPLTAGEIICETILNIISESEVD